MEICESLQDFLIKSRINQSDIGFYNKNPRDFSDDNLRYEVQYKFSELEKENECTKKSALSYAKQIQTIWNIIGNRTYEAYSIMFSDNHTDSKYHNHSFFIEVYPTRIIN